MPKVSTMSEQPRLQCIKCPWKIETDPREIPGGYCETKHRALKNTIARPADLQALFGDLRIMACHETTPERELPCVGWIANQMGPGNNLTLRLAIMKGGVLDGNVETIGLQHQRFENTLP